MKLLSLFFLIFIISFLFGYLGKNLFDKKNSQDAKVLSEASSLEEEIQSPTPTFSPTLTPKPTLTPTPTRVPTPTPKPQPPVTQEQIHVYIERFASQYGVDPNVLRHIAVCESGFNPLAVNGPYVGLYQFAKTAWKTNRASIGEETDSDLRFNAEEAVQTAAYVLSRGQTHIWPNCLP